MCTVVFQQCAGRVRIAMNRDERRGRAPESPPALGEDGPTRWIAPSDGEKGGTWIGVNDRGVAACLLNGYVRGDLALLARTDIPSRGGIIPSLLDSPSIDVGDWIRRELQAERYPSFTLLVWTQNGGTRVQWRLDEGLSCRPLPEGVWGMETSSAWRTKEVLAWRKDRFERWLGDGAPLIGPLPSFNLIEEPDRREWSPFMSRSFSATRSVTLAEVDRARGQVGLTWWPRPADGPISPAEPGASLRLDLATRETA
jgi:hypothetical protein